MSTLSTIHDPTELTELYSQYSRPVAKTYAHIWTKDLTHRQQWWSSNHRCIRKSRKDHRSRIGPIQSAETYCGEAVSADWVDYITCGTSLSLPVATTLLMSLCHGRFELLPIPSWGAMSHNNLLAWPILKNCVPFPTNAPQPWCLRSRSAMPTVHRRASYLYNRDSVVSQSCRASSNNAIQSKTRWSTE